MKTKLFSLFLALAASVGAMFAYDAEIDGLYYILDSTTQTAEVTYKSISYTGVNERWNITEANIPASVEYNFMTYSVTSIGAWAFQNCCSLTSLTIPNSVTSIGSSAFQGCSSLTSVTIPNSVTSIHAGAFSNCSSLPVINNIRYADTYLVEAVDKTPATYTIKDGTKWIGHDAFSGCSSLTSMTIPNSVTCIYGLAFYKCSCLTSVTIPNSVTSIGGAAFCGCSSLTSVSIPNNVASIDQGTFSCCSSLTSVTIPNSVTSIGQDAFNSCSSLASVTIPNSVTSIGEKAFYGCSSLNSITIPNSVTSIGGYAFAGSSIKKPVYNKHLFAYLPTSYEGAYIIPNGITSVISGAFKDCTGLASLTIPNSVTSIGYDACSGCTNLLSVAINSNAVANASSINNIFGSQVTNYVIGNNVSSIASNAFKGSSGLKNLVLGTNVKVIESGAFAGCNSIETITCYSMRPPTATIASAYFDDGSFPKSMPYSTIIYVPAACLNTYKMHDFWGVYDVRPIGAATTETTSVQVTPSETAATVAWPTVNGAETYEMVIKDKQGNVICTLIFNSNGQLTEIAFNAPSRNGAVEQTQTAGFSFTVTGLEEGTAYELTITSKDSNGATLDKKTIAFSTAGGTGVAGILPDEAPSTKIIRGGQLLILRGDKAYTVQGQEVK